MFAVLEFMDLLWIGAVVVVALSIMASGRAVSMRSPTGPEVARLRRLEAKVDLILRHLGLEYQDPGPASRLSDEVKELAADPTRKIAAIKLHREQTGLGLREAKDEIEAYMDGRR
jgi:hypothetical protein